MRESHDTTSSPRPARLPASTRLGAVRLQVADLERSLEYYAGVLGLGVLARAGDSAMLGVRGKPSAPPLVELRGRRGATPAPRNGRLGLYHFAILLPGRTHLGRFVRHLAALSVRPGAADHGVSEALYLWDPDGLGIEVYADRPRSAWERRDGEIVMTTEPLDLKALAEAAESTGAGRWEGIPPGTAIGHVHLHVGDLDEARAFYHEALGLERTVWSYPGALFLSAGGYHHHLGLNTWARGARPAGDDEARLVEWELLTPTADDAARALDRLRGAGHAVSDASVRDPWGTALRIAQG